MTESDEYTNLISEEQENSYIETDTPHKKMSDSPYENALSLIGK